MTEAGEEYNLVFTEYPTKGGGCKSLMINGDFGSTLLKNLPDSRDPVLIQIKFNTTNFDEKIFFKENFDVDDLDENELIESLIFWDYLSSNKMIGLFLFKIMMKFFYKKEDENFCNRREKKDDTYKNESSFFFLISPLKNYAVYTDIKECYISFKKIISKLNSESLNYADSPFLDGNKKFHSLHDFFYKSESFDNDTIIFNFLKNLLRFLCQKKPEPNFDEDTPSDPNFIEVCNPSNEIYEIYYSLRELYDYQDGEFKNSYELFLEEVHSFLSSDECGNTTNKMIIHLIKSEQNNYFLSRLLQTHSDVEIEVSPELKIALDELLTDTKTPEFLIDAIKSYITKE